MFAGLLTEAAGNACKSRRFHAVLRLFRPSGYPGSSQVLAQGYPKLRAKSFLRKASCNLAEACLKLQVHGDVRHDGVTMSEFALAGPPRRDQGVAALI